MILGITQRYVLSWILPAGEINQHARYLDADNNDRAPVLLQHTLNSQDVVHNNRSEVPSGQPGSSVWLPQGHLAAAQHVTDNRPPQVYQTGWPYLHGNAGFEQATDSLPSTAKYGESSLVRFRPDSLQDKPFGQPSLGVWSPHALQRGSTPNSEEQFKPQTTEQESASKYQSQYSVPFGEQEQSSHVDKEEGVAQWEGQSSPNSFSTANRLWKEEQAHEKIEQIHLSDHLQSSPNSFSTANRLWKEEQVHEKIEQLHLSDHLQSPPNSQSGIENTHYEEVLVHDKIKPQNSSDLPQSSSNSMSIPMETSQGTSADSGQGNAQNGASDDRDPVRRGRSWTDGAIADTSSDQHQRISQPCAEKVPVERVMSNDYHIEAAQHLHKCPVEMNYNCISKYFNSGGKNLGEGGFGIVYEGTMVKYIHVHVSVSTPTKFER